MCIIFPVKVRNSPAYLWKDLQTLILKKRLEMISSSFAFSKVKKNFDVTRESNQSIKNAIAFFQPFL